MLGLGDIVIPGIFIALLLRYDVSLRGAATFTFMLHSLVRKVYYYADPITLDAMGS